MNRITLIGFLGKDAEVRTTQSSRSFTVLSLATQRSWKDRATGDRKSETTWHRCIAWGKLGQYAATLRKGAHIQLEGELQAREYVPTSGKAGEAKRSITEIRVSSILHLDRAGKSASTGSEVPA